MKKILEYLLPILWMLFSLFLFLAPPSDFDTGNSLFDFPHKDKVAHIVIFGILSFLWMRVFNRTNLKTGTNISIYALIGFIVLSWAISTEVMQATLTTTRSGDILDVFADLFGGSLGIVGYHILNRTALKVFC
ncbi:VanZ family protein [Sediminitomix flava]|uniref:VanZ family protein n=1 Tax=Sediminitomix flava TaxID=379075 RepID=A0A315ZI87_SEDFL|nr:VanZ family protein [Sediminitomix flava]PWJ44933.1 VanZ family protein [Sediminitomix flava]